GCHWHPDQGQVTFSALNKSTITKKYASGTDRCGRAPGSRKRALGVCRDGRSYAQNERLSVKPTTATEQRIPLNLLIEWENNPRKTREEIDVVQMAASLASVGQQAPLIAFKPAGETLYRRSEERRVGEERRARGGTGADER